MNETRYVSFIIPAYNAEGCIENCISSIQKINRQDIEIIIIVNGSTDNTYNICKNIVDERIRVFDIKESGVSKARNFGIDIAKGKYITFVDADDIIVPDSYEQVLLEIQLGSDIIMFPYVQSSANKMIEIKGPFEKGKCTEKQVQQLLRMLLDIPTYKRKKNNNIGAKVWQYLYLKSYITTKNIRYNEKLPFAEDLCFCIDILKQNPRLQYNDKASYIYKINFGSASKRFRNDYWEELKLVYRHLSMSMGKELPNIAYGYGKAAIRHYCVYQKIGSKLREQIGKIINSNMFQGGLKELKFNKKTFIEKWEDTYYGKKNVGAIYIMEIVLMFPWRIYYKLKVKLLYED